MAKKATKKTAKGATNLVGVGIKADKGDEAAVERLSAAAAKAGLEPDDFATWKELAVALNGKGGKTKAAAKKKEPAEKDRFGSRVGTQAANINSVLSKKPQTPQEIRDALEAKGLPTSNVGNHLRKLWEMEVLAYDEETGGYSVA